MAAASYISTRPDINKFPVPDGWSIGNKLVEPSGFEAATFTSGTELVISFAGTYPGKLLGPTNSLGIPVDFVADLALGMGYSSEQLLQAAQYFLDRKRENPGATITLTGHSLGGGLAALVGVFFGKPAITFDQAPFANAAQDSSFLSNPLNLLTPDVAIGLRTDLLAGGYTEAELSPLSNFLTMRAANGGIPNANLVSTTRVDGEFLSDWMPISMYDIIGNPATPILHAPTTATGIDLHAQSLLIAFLQSDLTAATTSNPQQTLSKVTYKLTDLLAMLVDANLYSRSTDTPKENFLERLVRHEFGNAPNVINDVTVGAVTADAMLTRFTRDLWKLAQDNGLTLTNNFIAKALTAFAMQMYYEDTDNAKNANKTLFTDVNGGGGIQFDMADVAKSFKASFDAGTALDLDEAKGAVHIRNYIETAFTEGERNLINGILPLLRDWYVHAGASGMTATDTLNRNAFLLGGTASDILTGGNGTDLLIGNGDADTLTGGQGNDILLGGAGNDTYIYTTGDGLDTILDSGDQNTLKVDGQALTGGGEYGDSRVHRSNDGKHLYIGTNGQMLIDGNLIIQNYATGGSFGLAMTGPSAEADLPKLSGNGSDNFIGMAVHDRNPNDSQTAKATVPGGTAEVGDLSGGEAANILEGKAGSDILNGGAGDDRLYADSQIDVATAIANGNIVNSGSGLKGDWLAGGSDDDTLVGGAGKDVLSGGAGSDLLIGGAGDDDILGDIDYVATSFDWTVTDQAGFRYFDPVVETQAPADSAVDVIYAGEGNDYVWAGAGNDVVFGEGGDDRLAGNEGNDIIPGGAGSDQFVEHSGRILDSRESRRWRHGEQGSRPANDTAWRRTA